MADNSNAMNPTPEGDRALDSLAREWFPLMSKRELSSDELQRVRELQGRFSTMPDTDRERLKDMIRQMQQDAKPMFLGGPKGEETPDAQLTPNAMRAGLGRLAVSPAKLKDVADAVAAAPGAIGNAMTDLYGRIKRWETDPTLPSSRGDTDIGKDAFELGPGMLLPGAGRSAVGSLPKGEFELAALGGKGARNQTLVSQILNQPETQAAIKRMKIAGMSDAEVAGALNNKYRLDEETISSRAVTGNRQRAGIAGRTDERSAWSPEMVDTLRDLKAKHGSDRTSVIEGFRDAYPEYTGSDATLTVQMSKVERNGGVNAGLSPGPQTGKLTPEHRATIDELANNPDLMLKEKIAQFRAAHPEYEGSNGTIVRRLKEAASEGEGAELGVMGGIRRSLNNPASQFGLGEPANNFGRFTADDVAQMFRDHDYQNVKISEPKNGSASRYVTGEPPGNPPRGAADTPMVRVAPEDQHLGRAASGREVGNRIDTGTPGHNVSAKNTNIADWHNQGGVPYSEPEAVEGFLKWRKGDIVSPDEAPARTRETQRSVRGDNQNPPIEKIYAAKGEQPAYPEAERAPREGPDFHPDQLKLLSGGIPAPTSFPKGANSDELAREEATASRARELSNQMRTQSDEIDDLTAYPRLRFGLPAGFVLDKPNAMRPE